MRANENRATQTLLVASCGRFFSSGIALYFPRSTTFGARGYARLITMG